MGYTLALPVLAFLAAFQSSILPALRWQNGQPDLILLVVLAWAVRAPLPEALFWAFLGGLFHDLLSIVPLGTSAIAPILVVFLIDRLRQSLYGISPFLWLLLVILATVLHAAFVVVGLVLEGYSVPLADLARTSLLPTLVYHVVLAWPIYGLVWWLQRRYVLPRPERR